MGNCNNCEKDDLTNKIKRITYKEALFEKYNKKKKDYEIIKKEEEVLKKTIDLKSKEVHTNHDKDKYYFVIGKKLYLVTYIKIPKYDLNNNFIKKGKIKFEFISDREKHHKILDKVPNLNLDEKENKKGFENEFKFEKYFEPTNKIDFPYLISSENSISNSTNTKSNVFKYSYNKINSDSMRYSQTPKFEKFYSFPDLKSKEVQNMQFPKNNFTIVKESNINNRYLKNGGIYEGEILEGLPHGKGTIVYENGSFYEGNFIRGKKEGYGKYFETGVFTYTGEFSQDHFHGYGYLKMNNGDFYHGNFVNGKKEGEGLLKNKNGVILKIGQWKNDKFDH